MFTFKDFFPQFAGWIQNLEQVWLGPIFKPYFAHLEVWHIVSLFILGGCMILMNLRLLGVGLTTESPSSIEKNVRGWLAFGVFGVLASGVLIGFANAEKLYGSPAFTVKMISLLAAIIFTYAACVPTAKADGRVGTGAKVAVLIALLLWVVSLWLFATIVGLAPGIILVIIAAAMMVYIALQGRIRWVYVAGLAVIVAAHQVATHFVYDLNSGYDAFVTANKWFVRAEAVWVVAFAAYQVLAVRNPLAGGPLTRLVGFSSLLVWVTVAAAGRWIAFAS